MTEEDGTFYLLVFFFYTSPFSGKSKTQSKCLYLNKKKKKSISVGIHPSDFE